ncbi:hypothetical protein [Sphingomonas sp.]|uniref:hypothetical protein n=1 Tax=Sphingomonas sp. TaxID=28214 RepID=UPI002E1240F9|nr:hypothetical protein [Sphingomonas sp.]
MTERWGEQQHAARADRSRRRNRWLTIGVVALLIAIPFAIGVADGIRGAAGDGMPLPIRSALMLGVAALILAYLWSSWRAADEYHRATATLCLAAAGLVALVVPPVAEVIAPMFGQTLSFDLPWALAVVAAIGTWLWRRRG